MANKKEFIGRDELPFLMRLIKADIKKNSGTKITVDSELSETSTNPIQNGVVAKEFNKFAGTVEVTPDAPTKENTVLTVNTAGEEIKIYTAPEIDAKLTSYIDDVAALIGGDA